VAVPFSFEVLSDKVSVTNMLVLIRLLNSNVLAPVVVENFTVHPAGVLEMMIIEILQLD
jgi:hypothetical protein